LPQLRESPETAKLQSAGRLGALCVHATHASSITDVS
jgi:hypothetical protein